MKISTCLCLALLCGLFVGCEDDDDNPTVVLISPADRTRVQNPVEFSWAIRNSDGRTFRSELRFDYGVNPFDGWIEMALDAGNATNYNERLSRGGTFEWGVRIYDENGRQYDSEIRDIYIAL